MNVSETFIQRPIATSLLMAAIALFGTVAYKSLPVSDLPNVDFPTLLVTAALPGASPETMASAVATPLENQFSTIAGLIAMTSVNSLGSTQVTLEFDLNRSLDGAAVDTQAAITQASRLMPQNMPTPPTFTKVNPANQPIIFLSLRSKMVPLYTLDEYAETRIAQRISTISGVAQVQVLGQQKYAVHVQMDPRQLATHAVGINEVETALQAWNVNLPTGQITGPQRAFTLMASGQLTSADQYKSLIVSYRNGNPVRLQELGTLKDSVQDDKTASWYYENSSDGERAIVLGIQRQPGTNTIAVTDAIKKLIPTFRSELPPSVQMDVLYDHSDTIRESYSDVKFTMMLTLALVITVSFAFLRNVSATVIPSLALPFSIIGTFSVMYLLHYSLDNLSMMALILSVGFVVDDAIVMLENIFRHMEMGKKPLIASLVGSREIGFTIVSMTFSLAAVFIPVLFMGGILGRLFREFSVSICVAILISGLVSVTLTPMLCSRFLRSPEEQKRSWFYKITERFFDLLLRVYDQTLQVVLRHRAMTMAASLLVLAGTVIMFIQVPKGFIPDQDNDSMAVITEASQGTSYYQMAKYQQQVSELMASDPDIESFMSSTGGGFGATSNQGRMWVQLKPRKQRDLSVTQIVEKLRPKVSNLPGMRVFMTVPPSIRIGGRPSKTAFDFTLQGPDTQDLYVQAQKLEREMAQLPGLVDVTTDLQIKNPQVRLTIDRDRAGVSGLNVAAIEAALYDAYGPRWVSTIYAPTSQYKVLLELLPEYQKYADYLSLLYFKTPDEHLVPLASFAKTKTNAGPQSVNHSGQLPSVTVSFNLRPGVALGGAVDEVELTAERVLPANITTSFQGTAKAFQDSLKNLGILLTVAIMVVYIVLGVLYESYVHPLTILSGLPSAGFGALLTLLIFKVELSIYAFVGLIMLIGIVKKNAIMQIDFALEAERREGKSPKEAIYEGCLIRFRPIMMTTMAALLGAIPISLGYGSGG